MAADPALRPPSDPTPDPPVPAVRAGRGAGQLSPLRLMRSRGRLRGGLALLGPAFVASVAYIDPGNFATNFAAGARFGLGAAGVASALVPFVEFSFAVFPSLLPAMTGTAVTAKTNRLAIHFPSGLTVQ